MISEDSVPEDGIDVDADLDSGQTVLSDIIAADNDLESGQMDGTEMGQMDDVEIVWDLPVSNLLAKIIVDHHIHYMDRIRSSQIHSRRYSVLKVAATLPYSIPTGYVQDKRVSLDSYSSVEMLIYSALPPPYSMMFA